MFTEYNAMQYLAIDVANHYGLDKEIYEARIEWVKDNISRLEDLEPQADEPILYSKAVRALRAAMAGKEVGHAVALDSVCSGMQIMSAVMGCESGMAITGLIHQDERADAYTKVTEAMNERLPQFIEDNPDLVDLKQITVSRKDAKKAVMTSLYGSEAVPRNVFGERLLPLFYETMDAVAPGAMQLLALLRAAWNPEATVNTWQLPDGHMAVVPVTETVEKRICITELKYTPVVQLEVVQPQESGISLIANVVHSIDAYVLRTMLRRCNYGIRDVKHALYKLRTLEHLPRESEYLRVWQDTRIVDITMIHASEAEMAGFPRAMREKLINMLEMCLTHKPFEIVVIHDSYAVHPNNCNQLRKVYADIMGDLTDSTLIDDLLNQLYQDDDVVGKLGNTKQLADTVRQSNYGIC